LLRAATIAARVVGKAALIANYLPFSLIRHFDPGR
jgi:hypothetical protein